SRVLLCVTSFPTRRSSDLFRQIESLAVAYHLLTVLRQVRQFTGFGTRSDDDVLCRVFCSFTVFICNAYFFTFLNLSSSHDHVNFILLHQEGDPTAHFGGNPTAALYNF